MLYTEKFVTSEIASVGFSSTLYQTLVQRSLTGLANHRFLQIYLGIFVRAIRIIQYSSVILINSSFSDEMTSF